ncbi:hypothetical protein MMC07_005612 [Pseudocyphellaria aurata]|nr:hypothetical protein [Pseudocyphellaria aurata]
MFKAIQVAAAAAVVLSSTCDALYLAKRIDRRAPDIDVLPRATSKTLSQPLINNNGSGYYIEVSLGTPPQPVRLLVDTSSSDAWVNVRTSKFCQTADCSIAGTYNPGASTTNKFLSHDFRINYLDNRLSEYGDFVKDSLYFAGQELKDTQFGLATVDSHDTIGLLGLGAYNREQHTLDFAEVAYPNLPQILKNAELINTAAYSIWLNGRRNSQGTLLFGGIDTAKFHGDLTPLPLYSRFHDFEFLVNLTGLGFTSQADVSSEFGSTSTLPVPVLLDTAATLITLPEDIVREVWAKLRVTPAGQSNDDRIAFIACSRAQEESTLDFTFGAAKISVPLSELVLPLNPDQFGNPKVGAGGRTFCRLAITFAAKPTDTLILGNAFLRSAYLLFDLDHQVISIAPTNFDTAFTNVVELPPPRQ